MKAKIVEILKEYKYALSGIKADHTDEPSMNHYAKRIAHLYSAGEEVWAWVKPEDELPPTHHIVIGIDNDGTTVAYLWWNKEDNIWRYGFEGDGNVHAPEPEFWLKQITPPTVSEEEIYKTWRIFSDTLMDNGSEDCGDYMSKEAFFAAIKELLNR